MIAEEGNPQLTAAERGRWLARCDLEHDNFRAALDWVIGTGDADWAFRLGLALYGFWERREHLVEGRRRLEAIVNLDGAEALADAGHMALSCIAALGGARRRSATVRQRLHKTSLATFRALGNRKGEALALNALGSFSGSTARPDGACLTTSRP